MSLFDGCDQQHIRAVLVGSHLEILLDIFAEHRRREGPERLPEFDLQIHRLLHLDRARVAHDRTRAQGARAELGSIREMANDVLGRDQLRNVIDEFVVLLMKRIDALVVMTANTDPEFYRELWTLDDLPMVVLDSDAEMVACVVGDDSVMGGRLAAQFLVDREFRRIGFLTGPVGHPRSRDRWKGCRQVLREAGIVLDSVLKVTGELTISGGYMAMQDLLQLGCPDALFAFNDLMAMGAYRAAAEAGLTIPRDLSIIGYDDLEIAAYLNPALTTIHQPSFGLGAKAAEILIEHLEKKTELPATLTLEPRLVVRDSVAGLQEE